MPMMKHELLSSQVLAGLLFHAVRGRLLLSAADDAAQQHATALSANGSVCGEGGRSKSANGRPLATGAARRRQGWHCTSACLQATHLWDPHALKS
eukprot:15326726-Alexandrium_andersonii.AAC.1